VAEFLEDRGVSEREFAEAVGMRLSRVHGIIAQEHWALPPELEAFATYFGTSTELWANIQAGRFDAAGREVAAEMPHG
jgi:plasmid maintenance system antidote protein VapI